MGVLSTMIVAGGIPGLARGGDVSWSVAVGSRYEGYRGGMGHYPGGGRMGYPHGGYERPGWHPGYCRGVIVAEPVYYPVCPSPVVRYVEPATVYVQPAPYVPPVETAWIQNSNGSKTPVQLRRADGGMYIGPKGEYYLGWPTENQLRQVYGM